MPASGITLREAAFRRIKAGIVQGEWEGGAFLAEKKLCELLGMSKTPIRSALDRLEEAGLVKLVANQGFVVQEISSKKIMEIYQLRLSLETFAAAQLTGRMEAECLSRLDANLALQKRAADAEDIVAYVELDRQFHETIVSGLANEEYSEAMARIQDKFLMAVRATFYKNKKRLLGSVQEHRQIRDALAAADPAATTELVRKHIEYVERML